VFNYVGSVRCIAVMLSDHNKFLFSGVLNVVLASLVLARLKYRPETFASSGAAARNTELAAPLCGESENVALHRIWRGRFRGYPASSVF
jgi:hypothetical protein